MKRFAVALLSIGLVCGMVVAQDEERIDITGFEESFDWQFTGGNIIAGSSYVEDPTFFEVDPLEGDWALYLEYDKSSGLWSTSTLNFPDGAMDLSGMRELRMSFYIFPDSDPHPDNGYQMRFNIPTMSLGEHTVPEAGEWHELSIPIDRIASETTLASLDRIQILFLPGAEAAVGGMLIDNIYMVRPANTPSTKVTTIYGFNETNPDDDAPLGWTNMNAGPPILGGAWVEPTEGSDYMEIPATNWTQNVRTINAAADFDQWPQVVEMLVDLRISDDFSASWGQIYLVLSSNSGGTITFRNYKDVGGLKDEWRTVAWDVDMAPHLTSIENDDGSFEIRILTHSDSSVTGAVYLDDFRVGTTTSYTAAQRLISPTYFEGSETFDVEITITNSEDGKEVTVEETIPDGWTASEISNGGALTDGVITWDLTLPEGETVLTYKTTSPADPSEAGNWSGTIDGADVAGMNSAFFIYPALVENKVEAPFLSNSVDLDGKLDSAEYEGANTYSFNHDTSDGNTAPGVHLSGNEYPADEENVTFHVFHDENYIYVGMDIVDPSLNFSGSDDVWRNDSTELYFDGNFSRSSSKERNPFGPQLTVVGDGSAATSNGTAVEIQDLDGGGFSEEGKDSEGGEVYWGFGAAPKPDDSGYVVEYRVDKRVILDPPDRTLLGFEILMNSSEAGETDRTAKWGWYSSDASGEASEYWDDETGWGLMELQGGPSHVSDWSFF